MTVFSTIRKIELEVLAARREGAEQVEIFVSHKLFLELLDEVAEGLLKSKELARVSHEQRIAEAPIYQVHDRAFKGYRVYAK